MVTELCVKSEEKLSVNPQELAEKEFSQKINLSPNSLANFKYSICPACKGSK